MILLPPNATKELRAFEETLEQQLLKLQGIDLDLNPLTCKRDILPHLALIYSLDIASLSIDEQRQYIHNAFEIRRYQGTPYSIKKVFESFNVDASLIEWFDYGGEPYHFKVELAVVDKPITEEMIKRFEKYILLAKNMKSILETLHIKLTLKAKEKIGATVQIGEIATLYPYQLTQIEFLHSMQKIGATIQSIEILNIYPKGGE